MHVIVWDSGSGKAGWVVFVHRMLAAVNMIAGGPHVQASRVRGRHPIGTITVGEHSWRIRPGQSLVIRERLDPAGWRVDERSGRSPSDAAP